MKDCMWEEKSIRVEIMSLQFKEKMHSKQISFFNLLPKKVEGHKRFIRSSDFRFHNIS